MHTADARDRAQRLAHLNAFVSFSDEEGDGVVVAVKDLIDVEGMVTTAGSIFAGDVAAEADAPVVKRVRAHGGIIVGKTNLHEWGYGVTSENPYFGTVVNPHDPSRVAGGSSGGSAVAVAMRMCDWALGTDTGGSIRIPAALCGVAGLKPSLGLLEVEGVVPLSPTLDTVGPLAADVVGIAAAMDVLADWESTDLGEPVPLSQLRLGVPQGWVDDLDPTVGDIWDRLAGHLDDVPFPHWRVLREPGITILRAEATGVHRERMANHPDRYGADVLALLREGVDIDAARYAAALERRVSLAAEADAAMADLDALIVPTTACVAPRAGNGDVREPLTRFTRPFNVTGQPALTLPAPTLGLPGLPVGIQIVGRVGQDQHLLRVAHALESEWVSERRRWAGWPE